MDESHPGEHGVPQGIRALGEWGADVIKIEAAKGDPGRVNQAVVFGMTADDDENLGFDMANMHKRFISLNLKSEKGLLLFPLLYFRM